LNHYALSPSIAGTTELAEKDAAPAGTVLSNQIGTDAGLVVNVIVSAATYVPPHPAEFIEK
jgi:hypothetical protein